MLQYVCEFILSVTSFSHERTFTLSNLSLGILLLENVFEISSLLNNISGWLVKSYALSQLMERVPFSNVTELRSQLPFWDLYFCFPSFPWDNSNSPLFLLSVLRYLGFPLDIITLVTSAIYQVIMCYFWIKNIKKRFQQRFDILILSSKYWEHSIKHSYGLFCIVPIDI